MSSIRVSVGGKTYPLRVEDGDEPMMMEIARMVDDRLKNFRSALATQPETTALVMTSLSIAEELYLAMKNPASGNNQPDHSSVIAAFKSDLNKIINSAK